MSRRWIIVTVAVLAAYGLMELAAFIGLEALRKYQDLRVAGEAPQLAPETKKALEQVATSGVARRVDLHAELGWVHTPGAFKSRYGLDAVNKSGMRDDRDYAEFPAEGVLRIAAFGESFTYGAEVALGENWAKLLSAMEPTVEVLNYGVGGYGLDQAYLRYLEAGREHNPDVVLIGYMSENMARSVSVYRPFLVPQGNLALSKPRFLLEGGKLVLLPNPMRSVDDYRTLLENTDEGLARLGEHDAHYRAAHQPSWLNFSPTVRLIKTLAARLASGEETWRDERGMCDPKTEAFEVTLAIMESFYRRVLENGQLPLIVVFPYRYDFWRSYEGKPLHYGPFLEAMRAKGLPYIDTFDAFLPISSPAQIDAFIGGHFTAEGNRIVAEYLLGQLRKDNLMNRKSVRERIQAERKRLGIRGSEGAVAP